MNDATIAADVQAEESKEAHDFVEMGTVSEETKGGILGNWFDGVPSGRHVMACNPAAMLSRMK